MATKPRRTVNGATIEEFRQPVDPKHKSATRAEQVASGNLFNSPHPNSVAARILRGNDPKLKARYREWQRNLRKDAGALEKWYATDQQGQGNWQEGRG